MTSDKIILFDFDGVIVDSFDAAYQSHKILESNNFTEEDGRKLFEGNVFEEQDKKYGKEIFTQEQFFTIYVPRLLESKIVDGIGDALAELSEDYRLIIISSTTSDLIKQWMAKHDLNRHFLEIMGSDIHRSKVEKIKMVFEKYGADKNNYVFITDTLGDIKEANHLGISSLAVTYGFHNQETLLKGNPVGLIKHQKDIKAEVKKYWKNNG